jgi:hypothetical protein
VNREPIQRPDLSRLEEIALIAEQQGRALVGVSPGGAEVLEDSGLYVLRDESCGYECFPFGATLDQVARYLVTFPPGRPKASATSNAR